jgi:hypothetical protein
MMTVVIATAATEVAVEAVSVAGKAPVAAVPVQWRYFWPLFKLARQQ